MENSARDWVNAHSTLTGNTRLVLLAIAEHIDQHPEAPFPTQTALAEALHITRRTIYRAIATAKDAGELEVEHITQRAVIYSLAGFGYDS